MERRRRAFIESDVRRYWPEIVRRSRVTHPAALTALPKGPLHSIGESAKVILGESIGVMTGIRYLAPGNVSGRDVCPWRTVECSAACLGTESGRMRFDSIRGAQVWRTALRFGAPDLADALLDHDLDALLLRAIGAGMDAAARLDGTSDLGDALRFIDRHPGIRFYDYTKSERRAFDALGTRWHVTLSYSGHNRSACIDFLRRGGNVAVPFAVVKGQPLPATWEGFDVINGDEHDYRPADPAGVVVGLRMKGPKANRTRMIASGWAQ